MKKRDVLNSPRLREINRKRTRVLRNKFFIGFLTFAFLFSIFAIASRAESININIKSIEVSGNKTISAGVIEEGAREVLSGHYLWVFPKTNFFLYPKSKMIEDLQNKHTLLKNIEVTLKEGGILGISFEERIPTYTWCGEDLPSSAEDFQDRSCFFMDESGYVFDEAPYFSGNVYFRFFGSIESEDGTPLGHHYFPEIWQNLNSFRITLTEMDLKPSSIYVTDEGDVEVYLASKALPPNSQKIIYKKDADLELLAENLNFALDTEPLKTDFKQKYSELEYLDLRFGNKVFFKFK
jgi:hypothetical protein